tara:strand:+ start:191 stop:706 length:516 start_codon:yes stop_codon:yes gene_type:complete
MGQYSFYQKNYSRSFTRGLGYSNLKLDELKSILKARGVSASGTKAELVSRVEAIESPEATLFSTFTMLLISGYSLSIIHLYLQTDPVWFVYYPSALLQLVLLLLFLVFGHVETTEPISKRLKQPKESEVESDPIPLVAATPVFELEQYTDKSIKEIEEEQKALVSEMEDES